MIEPRTYTFIPVGSCDMCGADPSRFKVLGMRLNGTQGISPKRATGIAVSVKQCLNCELIFADPQPVPAHISDHYKEPEDYWQPEYFAEEENYLADDIVKVRELLGRKDNIRALDVGAGIGKAMKAMTALGFDTFGVEPSAGFRSIAVTKMGIAPDRLLLATVEEAEFPPGYFDFISLDAVFEHLHSPAAALERALGWLAPGGIIRIEVPSSAHFVSRFVNLFFRLRGTNYVTNISPMHVPFHLYEFGLRSFEEGGRRLGYDVAHHDYLVCGIYHFPRFLHPLLRWYMERTGTGMQLAVYLRKSGADGRAGAEPPLAGTAR